MSIYLGNQEIRAYLGDIPISGGGSGELPEFKGYMRNGSAGIMIPYSGTSFDTSKTFDIIFCFWLGTIPTEPVGGAAFGASHYNWFYYYPSVEITVGESSSIWYGVSNDVSSGWNVINKRISFVFTTNSYNYIKLSYSTDTNLVILSHSVDGVTWNTIDSTDITGKTIANYTDEIFCFGSSGEADSLVFPATPDVHLAVEKCKIISQGNTIFGYEE